MDIKDKGGIKLKAKDNEKEDLLLVSNHPPERWGEEQKEEWNVIDYIPFPNVPPQASFRDVIELSIPLFKKMKEWKSNHIHGKFSIQGEFTLTSILISDCNKKYGWYLTFPTTERKIIEKTNKDGSSTKSTIFKFERWR